MYGNNQVYGNSRAHYHMERRRFKFEDTSIGGKRFSDGLGYQQSPGDFLATAEILLKFMNDIVTVQKPFDIVRCTTLPEQIIPYTRMLHTVPVKEAVSVAWAPVTFDDIDYMIEKFMPTPHSHLVSDDIWRLSTSEWSVTFSTVNNPLWQEGIVEFLWDWGDYDNRYPQIRKAADFKIHGDRDALARDVTIMKLSL